MAFAVATVARGGKVVVSGLMGGNFSLPMVQWVYKRMTIEGFMVGTLAEGKELMALARAGKIKPTPMKEEPMADVQKWIEELRAGQGCRADRAEELRRRSPITAASYIRPATTASHSGARLSASSIQHVDNRRNSARLPRYLAAGRVLSYPPIIVAP